MPGRLQETRVAAETGTSKIPCLFRYCSGFGMAPVFGFAAVAGCSPRLVLLVFCAILLLNLSTNVVSTAWVYDRQTMLLIRSSMEVCGGVCTWSGPGAFSAQFICPLHPLSAMEKA